LRHPSQELLAAGDRQCRPIVNHQFQGVADEDPSAPIVTPNADDLTDPTECRAAAVAVGGSKS
jgi:hypothetical protein